MSIENWDRVQSLFFAVADLAPADQARFLDANCESPEVRRQVESLLDGDRHQDDGIASAVGHAAALVDSAALPGNRLGAYRIQKEIGSGGMGSVYLAVRDDDQFEKKVAIKLIRRGLDTAEMLQRFRHERQILANLDHPHIARLLDGGSTPDGRPFFVMEHIEGEPLDAYCRNHKLTLRERCRLFVMVCDAVSHAHRNLVVHRDLKPGNILVTADGTPKLLDFGVAKLLNAEPAAGRTLIMGMIPMTPDYASPEQVRGEPVTTATDVYALGAVLYELITQEKAQKIESPTAREIERAVCETEPTRPSLAARTTGVPWRPDSDLDNIIARAMHKQPARRYQSADALREDLQRYLDGLPVLARGDSFAYRTRKFLRRHMLPVAAAAAVLISIVVGAWMALQQAREASAQREIALHERDRAEQQRAAAEKEHAFALVQRDRAEAESKEAQTQRTRAEKRLQDLVELANTSFYDVEETLSRQSGTAEARRKVVGTALDYLDKLAADGNSDPDLAVAIAVGYMKMGDVLGRTNMPNLGDRPGALKSYRKAWALLDTLRTGKGGREAVLLWIEVGVRIGDELLESGAYQEGITTFNRLMPDMRQQVARYGDHRALELQYLTLKGASMAHANRVSPQGVDLARQAVAAAERLVALHPKEARYLESLEGAASNAAFAMLALRDFDGSFEYAKKSVAVSETLAALAPTDVLRQNKLMMSYMRVADAIGGHYYRGPKPDHAAALDYYRKSLVIARQHLQADPKSPNNRTDYGLILTRAGAVPPVDAAREESFRMLNEAATYVEEAVQRAPKSYTFRATLNLNYQYKARRLAELGRFDEAVEAARRAIASADALVRDDPANATSYALAMAPRETLATALASKGNRGDALAAAREAIDTAARFATKGPQPERLAIWPPRAQEWLGNVYSILQDAASARREWEASRAQWQALLGKPIVGAPKEEIARLDRRLAETPRLPH